MLYFVQKRGDNMGNENNIVRVEVITNCRLLNTHHNLKGIRKSIMRIDYKNGKCRELDLTTKLDITDVDYLQVIYPVWSKKYLLFEESEDAL